MVMFGEFCNRYAGKEYPQGKIAFAKSYSKGEEDVTFFIKVQIVEEIGDYYNVALTRDERVDPFVREINSIHHIDEARHIVFGHRVLKKSWEEFSPKWPDEVIDNLRAWLAEYLKSSWTDFYNPRVYRDAGIPDAYEVRQAALRSPVCLEHRRRVSKKLIDYFLETGILLSEPSL